MLDIISTLLDEYGYIFIYKKGEARPKRIQDFQTGGYQTAGRDLTKAINSFIRKPGANPVSDEPYIADIDVTYSEATGPVEPKVGPQSTRVLWKETLKLEF